MANLLRYPTLAAFYRRGEQGERLRIAFLGGSITWGATATDPLKTSWRARVTRHFERRFPRAHIQGIDAAIGGTPSQLGVFRMDRDVLPYHPDLTFVEFTVNDGTTATSQETMEGIVRKLHHANPRMAIVLVIIGAGYDYQDCGNRERHLQLAGYYGLPVVDVCQAVQRKVRGGLDPHAFLHDGCHPNDAGYRLYADLIQRQIDRLAARPGVPTRWPTRALTANRFETARMLELAQQADQGGWQSAQPAVTGTWFDHQPSRWLSTAIAPVRRNATLSLTAACRGVGLYYEMVRDGGSVVLEADGDPALRVSTAMDMPEARVGHALALFEERKRRTLCLRALQRERIKIAYLLHV